MALCLPVSGLDVGLLQPSDSDSVWAFDHQLSGSRVFARGNICPWFSWVSGLPTAHLGLLGLHLHMSQFLTETPPLRSVGSVSLENPDKHIIQNANRSLFIMTLNDKHHKLR